VVPRAAEFSRFPFAIKQCSRFAVFGLKVGPTSAGAFDARVRQLVDGLPRLTAIIRPLLEARAALRSQFAVLHRQLLDLLTLDERSYDSHFAARELR
jgi:hypothetical protein